MHRTSWRISRLASFFRHSLIVLGCALWLGGVQAAENRGSYQAALESITAADLGHYAGRLADKDLEGRMSGTRGGHAAGDYLVAQLTHLHLHPAGADGSFFQPFAPNFRNVLAMLTGGDDALRNQVIVVGAHYDHVGYGGRGLSLDPGGAIHPGADDNASGTSAVLKLADAFTRLASPPKRSILFAFWDAEERGLLGTKHWTAHPTLPLSHVVAALNLDMIGRLRKNHLAIFGSRTGVGWRRLLSCENDATGFDLEFPWTLKPNADHYTFFDHGIPVVMMHTGLHPDYHRVTDTADRLNREGMMEVTRFVFAVAYRLAERSVPPAFRPAARHENEPMRREVLAQHGQPPDRLEVGWASDATAAGRVRISRITPGSPAERAGLQVGDCIRQVAGRRIHNEDDFVAAVSSAASPALLTVEREGERRPLKLVVQLSGAPLRWGITWRLDDAEPGTIILAYVVPYSPAAAAGLRIGDRIYQVDGRDFADEATFIRWSKTLRGPISLLIERHGRLRTMVLQLQQSQPVKRAA